VREVDMEERIAAPIVVIVLDAGVFIDDELCRHCGRHLFQVPEHPGFYWHTQTGCVSCDAVSDGEGAWEEPESYFRRGL
jgi:hypothetical protein